MVKTTIDGLRVRTPEKKQPVATSGRRPTIDVMARRPRTTTQSRHAVSGPRAGQSTVSAAERAYRARQRQQSMQQAEDFLEPVGAFDGGEYPPGSLTASDFTSDTHNMPEEWSDLLGEMGRAMDTSPSQPLALGSGLEAEFGTDFDDDLTSEDLEIENAPEDWATGLDELGVDFGSEFGEEIDEPTRRERKKQRKQEKRQRPRSKRKKVRRIVTAVFFVCLLGGAAALYFWGDGLIARLTGGKSGFWSTLSAMVSDVVPFETDAKGRTNILVFGTEGYNMNGDTAYGQHDGAQLTDSIMVISFDQNTRDVALLSLPRDLKVAGACYAGKLNEVFTCHNDNGKDENAGAEAMMKEIGKVLGIDFQYYAHVNWASLIDIVDRLGGVTITLDEDVNDVNYTGATAKAGVPKTVNGEEALALARARHGTAGGDFTRGNTQQKIVAAIVNKIMNSGMNINDALALLNILGDNLRTNISTDYVRAGLQLIKGFDMNNIRHVSLANYQENVCYVTTAMIDGVSYVVPSAGNGNYSEIQAYIARMFSSDAAMREEAKIAVYNATNGAGVAGAERTQLETDGFIVTSVGNANSSVCQAKHCVFALNDGKPGTARKLAERYGVEVISGDAVPAEVRDSKADFAVVVGGGE